MGYSSRVHKNGWRSDKKDQQCSVYPDNIHRCYVAVRGAQHVKGADLCVCSCGATK